MLRNLGISAIPLHGKLSQVSVCERCVDNIPHL